jgi:hypothetical protein
VVRTSKRPKVSVGFRKRQPTLASLIRLERPKVWSMSVAGTWNVVTDTPVGKQTIVVELAGTDDALRGAAKDRWHPHDLELRDIRVDGDKLSWAMSMTKPVRLELTYDVTIDGDTMSGQAKAGRLLRSKVSGERIPPKQ